MLFYLISLFGHNEYSTQAPSEYLDEINNYQKIPEYGSPNYEYFNGYPCADGCSGHKAGYKWAFDNGIYDPRNCGGNSKSFIEGCLSYIEELNNIRDTINEGFYFENDYVEDY